MQYLYQMCGDKDNWRRECVFQRNRINRVCVCVCVCVCMERERERDFKKSAHVIMGLASLNLQSRQAD